MAGVEPLRATTCATCATCATYATCAGALLLGVLAAPDLPQVHWSALPTEVWLNVAFLAVGAAALANLLHYRGVAAVGPASASLMMFTVPVVSPLFATLVLLSSAVRGHPGGGCRGGRSSGRPTPGHGVPPRHMVTVSDAPSVNIAAVGAAPCR